MDLFEFLKFHLNLGNGDLVFLYAWKKDWKITAPETAKRIGIRTSHALHILNSYQAKGYCKRYTENGSRIYTYQFNGKGKEIARRVLDYKVLPNVPFDKDKLKQCNEINVYYEIEK